MSIEGQSPAKLANLVDTIGGIASEISKHPCVTYLDDVQLSDNLVSGVMKNAAVVACSDVGAWVPYVCSSASVKLFLFQNFGHHFESGGMVETIVGKGIQNVVVYGHSDCKYIKFLARPENSDKTKTEEQRQLYVAALESDSQAAWKTVGQYNVLVELKQMLADPIIGPLAASGKLNLHGWFYDAVAAQIEVFAPKIKAFIGVPK
ncbi:MAG: hypothetical protein C0507_03195 [Cyanobacteria bacterium PR.3.49]|nr:hypothetical protein [Cyanobacteria bacterium PR.3.49]